MAAGLPLPRAKPAAAAAGWPPELSAEKERLRMLRGSAVGCAAAEPAERRMGDLSPLTRSGAPDDAPRGGSATSSSS